MPTWFRIFAILFLLLIPSHPAAATDELCVTTPEGLAAARRAIAEIESLAQKAPTLPLQQVQGIYPLDEFLRNQGVVPSRPRDFPPQHPLTPFGTPVMPYMYGQTTPAPPALQPSKPEEKRFSWWGYRHRELHDSGVIAELRLKTGDNTCCDGIDSGECRITSYVTENIIGKRKVLVDGMPCDVTDETRVVTLEKLQTDDLDKVVVCAGKTETGNGVRRTCPKTYCVGRARTTT